MSIIGEMRAERRELEMQIKQLRAELAVAQEEAALMRETLRELADASHQLYDASDVPDRSPVEHGYLVAEGKAWSVLGAHDCPRVYYEPNSMDGVWVFVDENGDETNCDSEAEARAFLNETAGETAGTPEPSVSASPQVRGIVEAGDRARTGDIQLGKVAPDPGTPTVFPETQGRQRAGSRTETHGTAPKPPAKPPAPEGA